MELSTDGAISPVTSLEKAMSISKTSPYHRRQDLGLASSLASKFDEELSSGPFDIIRTKHASIERLKRWKNDAPIQNDIIQNNSIWIYLNRWRVKGLVDILKTDLEKGIDGDDADILKWRNAFGSNTYPRKQGWSFWMFLSEAWQDLTLIILMVAAVASLALSIKTERLSKFLKPKKIQTNYSIVAQRIFVGTLIGGTIRKLKDRAQRYIINTLIWGIYKMSYAHKLEKSLACNMSYAHKLDKSLACCKGFKTMKEPLNF